MTTPAELLLRKLRQQVLIEGFKVCLARRYAELLLHRHERKLPDTATTIAFFVVLAGDAVDRIEVHVAKEPVQVHQLVNNKRTWRTTTAAPDDMEAVPEDDGNTPPPAAEIGTTMDLIATQLAGMRTKVTEPREHPAL